MHPTTDITPCVREYKTARGWAIFMYLFTPLLIALFGGGAIMMVLADDVSVELRGFLGIFFLVMAGVMIVGLLDTIKGRVLINSSCYL